MNLVQKDPFRFFLLVVFYSFVYSAISFSQGTLSGIITDAKSGEVAINAQLLLYPDTAVSYKSPLRSALTNKFGFYSMIQIPDGNYVLYVRLIGYKLFKDSIVISSSNNVKKNILLEEEPVQLEEVTVEETRVLVNAPTLSRIEVATELIQTMPALGGEKDVFRVLQLLPGVKSASEISSGLYIRGGSPDQNLTLLDGVIVYNPFHLGGFLSTFNPDAVLNVSLLKGSFPAEYGGRLSSVIDITMKEGTKEKFTGNGGVSLISSRLTLQGPVSEDITYMLSGRRMYLDILMWIGGAKKDAPRYYFYDFNGKINYTLMSNDRLFLSSYYGADVFSSEPESNESNVEINWGNSTTNLRWMHIVNSSLFTNFSVVYTDYKFKTVIKDNGDEGSYAENNFRSFSQVQDIALKANVQYHPLPDHLIKTGVDATLHRFIANANISFDVDLSANQTDISAWEGAWYLQDEWNITPLLNSSIGFRLYYFQKGNYVKPEPRISFAYSLDEKTALKISYASSHQFLHLITRNDLLLPTDVWFPSTSTIKPGESWQIVTGVETSLLGSEYISSLEFYYKKLKNLYEYRDDAEFSLGVPLENQFTKGNGVAYGAEIFVHKKIGEITGWLGYTLSWTKRKFDALNLGREFYPRYDRRHDISLVLNYRLGENWEFGGSWVYGTGQAFTVASGFYPFTSVLNSGVPSSAGYWSYYPDVSQRNNYRAPAFHKLDLNFIHYRNIWGLQSQLSINIYNVYNRHNAFALFVDYKNDQSTGREMPVLKQLSLFPIIPTVGWSFAF